MSLVTPIVLECKSYPEHSVFFKALSKRAWDAGQGSVCARSAVSRAAFAGQRTADASCMPRGKPSRLCPQGRDSAGRPARLMGTVYTSFSYSRVVL